MTQPTPPEPADRPVCGEPADASRFFRCQKDANHYGERHHVDFVAGSYTWGYVPTLAEVTA